MSAIGDVYDLRGLRDAVTLAALIMRPFDRVHPDHADVPPLTGEQSLQFARHPDMRRPINRVLAQALEFDRLPWGEPHLSRLGREPRSRLALVLLTAPRAELERAALLLAAAMLHRRVVKVVLKSARTRVSEALGAEALAVATREAPMLHGPLGDIDSGSVFETMIAPETGLDDARLLAVRLGLAAFGRFLDLVEPDFVRVFALHRGPEDEIDERARLVPALNDLQAAHITKLMQRRMEPWRVSIG